VFYLFLVLSVILVAAGVYHLIPKNRVVSLYVGKVRTGHAIAAVSKPNLAGFLLVIAFLTALLSVALFR